MTEETSGKSTFTKSEGFILVTRMTQVIGIPIVITLGGWLLSSINGLDQSVIKLQTQMEERTNDRYTATDAKHDFAVIGVQIGDLDRRVGVLEADELETYRGRRR